MKVSDALATCAVNYRCLNESSLLFTADLLRQCVIRCPAVVGAYQCQNHRLPDCQHDVRRLSLGNLEITTHAKNSLLLESVHAFKYQKFKLLLNLVLFTQLADALTVLEHEWGWTFLAVFYCTESMLCHV